MGTLFFLNCTSGAGEIFHHYRVGLVFGNKQSHVSSSILHTGCKPIVNHCVVIL